MGSWERRLDVVMGGSEGVRKIDVGRERHMGRQDSEGSGPHRTRHVGS